MPSPRFNTTRWSVVLRAADPTTELGRDAYAMLCQTYWYPVYAFVRHRGSSHHEAEDLTQEFFARLLDKQSLATADPEKGRFRTFLLVCLKRFLANQAAFRNAQKRGGGQKHLRIDLTDADQRYRAEPADNLTPERLFDRHWAVTLLHEVLSALQTEMEARNRGHIFDHLKPYLVAEPDAPSYKTTADSLQMTETAVKVTVHRLRNRYRDLLNDHISQTLDDPTMVEDEIQTLFQALS